MALWRDMKTHAQELLHTAKSRLIVDTNKEPDGFASHEVGTVRMGTDPRTSVLNGHCQSHEIPNLFVVDGSCFPTFPEKNPTLTIMALAVRAARIHPGNQAGKASSDPWRLRTERRRMRSRGSAMLC